MRLSRTHLVDVFRSYFESIDPIELNPYVHVVRAMDELIYASGYKCGLLYCNNRATKNPDNKISFFSFPKDPARCDVWIQKCNPQHLRTSDKDILIKNYRLCSKHFEEVMFTQNPKRNRLLPHAIPTVFKNNFLLKPIIPSTAKCQTSNNDASHNVQCSTSESSFVQHGQSATEVSNTDFQPKSSPYQIITPTVKCRVSNDTLFSMQCSTLGSVSKSTIITDIETVPSSSQTLNALFSKTPHNHILQRKLVDAICTNKKLEKRLQETSTLKYCLQLCEQFLTPSLFMLVRNNLLNKNKNINGKRYSKKIKQFALTIYFFNPTIFKFLEKSFLLPSIRTLRRVTYKYNINSGLNDLVFNFIEFKISNISSDALDCFLCADKMSLKSHLFYNVSKDHIFGFNQSNLHETYEPATHALVFMIHGVNVDWKQQIAYFLVSSCIGINLNVIIFSMIRRLQNIGINVKAFITDQGTSFVSFSKSIQVSHSEPCFEVDGQKIVYIYYPSHLLKVTRNMFFKHSLHINDDVIEKKYLDTYYNHDSNCNPRLTPKLTNTHIHPGPVDRMSVSLATQVFSSSVAAGMSTAMNSGVLPITARPTIDFISNMDKLSDIFNSLDAPNGNVFNRPFQNISPQTDHLSKMTELFKNMRVINNNKKCDVTDRVNFINGWLITINGLKMLWEILNPFKKDEYVLHTRRLNPDFLENWVGKVRKKHGSFSNPTPVQFVKAFKKLFCLDYFQQSPGANRIEDLDQILCKMNEPSSNKILNVMTLHQNNLKFSPILIDIVDYRHLNIPEKNVLTFICGYLMNKCLEKHVCDICIDYACCQKSLDQSFLQSFFKSHFSTDNSTREDFYNYIMKLENIFIDNFPKIATEDNVGTKLKDFFTNVRLNHPCDFFEKTYLVKLFVRFRIFMAIKFINKYIISKKNCTLPVLQHLSLPDNFSTTTIHLKNSN